MLLEIENVKEEELFWVNALNNDFTVLNLVELVRLLQPRKVIALGRVAQKSCEDQGISCIKSYHPQYWKRFRNKERYPLLDLLGDAR
jgi:hypothetical protein